ncbi:oligosaccharide flippase family protein [Mucilaginibacter sp. SMC90]|uniref:oligosaccharide flippase family protein n=1 Tax=Mucilaginibacter sp. SMC90 TaxID=2929803 RepID=UPI001FB54470|nr:oligosaccharide flippase family protein [Mucilaginibacter sp. SMC90]UOE48194.1 oligosaccharide flippase family protein [Mucilaginibacter sp. SMC90]
MANFKKGLLKNILISGGYIYASQIINFAASTIVSRLLTPSSYGLVGLITVFTGFILVFSDGGLSYALIRSDFGRTYQRVLTNLAWVLGGILFIITLLLAYPIAVFYHNPLLTKPTIVLGFTFILRSLSLAQGAVLSKQLKFGFIGKVTLICMVQSVIITIIMAWLKFSYWSLIVPQVTTALITAVLYEREVKLGFKIYPYSYFIVVFKHTRKLIGSVIGFNSVNYWSRNADNMVVGKWYGAQELGIYNRAYSLLTLPLNLISGIFNSILFPSLKKLKSEGGDIEKEYYFVLTVITFLSYLLVVTFILFPENLVNVLWGKAWLQVATLLPYFGLLIYTQTLLSTVGSLLVLKEKEREFMVSGWVSAVFLVGAIILGGLISLKAIAAYYSFSFILFVLTFQLYYSYIKALNFNKLRVYKFWIPKILISLALWFSIYFELQIFKVVFLAILTIYIGFDASAELSKLYQIASKKIWKR